MEHDIPNDPLTSVLSCSCFKTLATIPTSRRIPSYTEFWLTHGPPGTQYTVNARKEVILTAGSFNTPQLLMLSGIGDKAELSQFNISTLVNLPSVGKNMSDHTLLASTFKVNAQDTLQNWANSTNLPGETAQWNNNHSGVLGDGGFRQLAWLRLPPTDPIFKTFADPSAGPTSAHYEFIFGVSPLSFLTL